MKQSPLLRYILMIVALSLWAMFSFVLPDFIEVIQDHMLSWWTIGAYVLLIGVVSALVLFILGLNRYVACVGFPLFGLLGAAVSYYRMAYHVTITPMIIEVVFHTNMEEAQGVISWAMIAWCVLHMGIGIGAALWRWHMPSLRYHWVYALGALLLLIGYTHLNSRLAIGLRQRYPINLVWNMRLYLDYRHDAHIARIIPPYQYTPQSRPDIILVLGEAVRADHLSINGYSRPTTPLLIDEPNLISLTDVYSPYTHTLASLPYILTRADSANLHRMQEETSFAPIFRAIGYHTAWISNQDMGENFSHFLLDCDTNIWVNAGKTVYVMDKCLDEAILPYVDRLGRDSAQLLILHTIGSHWYYNNHVPDHMMPFQPITHSKVITGNSPEEIVNSYDNTILYTDWFLHSLIDRYRQRNALIIYLSDHGESLGEDGKWVHANDTEPEHHPACILWYSDLYAQSFPDRVEYMQKIRTNHLRTDFLYPFILYAAGISAR